MPKGDRLCHGDFHPINVLGQTSQPLVIDWPDACRGDPSADVCRSYLLLKLHAAEIAEPYLDAYCRITNISRVTIVGWLPYVAAARLAEDVPNDFERLLETGSKHRRQLLCAITSGIGTLIQADEFRATVNKFFHEICYSLQKGGFENG